MDSWAIHELIETLAELSATDDEQRAVQLAVERAAATVEGELGAFVRDGRLVYSIGFAAGQVPEAELLELAERRRTTIDVPGAGRCRALVAAVDNEPGAKIVVGRSGDQPFSSKEISLVCGISRVLSLSLRMQQTLLGERTLRKERDRQRRVLEELSRLQRAIAQRRPLQEVLDAAVTGASRLLNDPVAALLLVDPDDPAFLHMVASLGTQGLVRTHRPRIECGEGAAGRAVSENRLVVIEDDAPALRIASELARMTIYSAMAAPVREDGQVIGSLVVASGQPGRRFDAEEQDLLTAFADHASMALIDAKTLDQMRQAFHDSLTGLPNRALFLDRLEHALARVSRDRRPVAVLFVDLDGFKTVNDSLGHAAGDQLLEQVAARLRDGIRSSDTVARLGGDEFAVLVEEDVSPTGLAKLAGHLIRVIEQPFELRGRELAISASVGIDVSHAGDETADDLIRNADVAMYRAKRDGKGQSALFEAGMHAAVLHRLELEAELRRALGLGELGIHYQPIVDLGSGQPVIVEALVRWEHPRLGAIPPSEFVPIAEETGLVPELDRLVLERACRLLAELTAAGADQLLSVGVNLSVRHLLAEDFVEKVVAALERAGCDPRRLVLEITESVLLRDAELGRDNLRRLKRLGARIAIDDFGAGFSSLSYLRDFPVDIIKIDKSFIDDIAGPGEATLAQAIVELGHTLDLQVVAEGIETWEQVDKLHAIGCDLGQGFVFSESLAPEQLLRYLRQRIGAREPFLLAEAQ